MPPSTRPETRTEGQDVVDKLAQHDRKLRQENEEISAYVRGAKALVKHTWFLGSAIAATALWLGKMQWQQAAHDDAIKALNAFRDTSREIRGSDQLLIAAIQNSVTANRSERMNDIRAINENVSHQQQMWEKWTVPISEMWFMKSHGISNKENYFRENSKSAPSSPE